MRSAVANEFKVEFDKAKVLNGGSGESASAAASPAKKEEKKGEDTLLSVINARHARAPSRVPAAHVGRACRRFKAIKSDEVKGFWTALDADSKGLSKDAATQVLRKVADAVFSTDGSVTVDAADKIKATLPAIVDQAIKGHDVLTWEQFAAIAEVKAVSQ